MIAPETLAAVLRVAQHGVHRAMLTARGDDAVDHPQGTDNLLHAAAARNLPLKRALQEPRMPARLSMPPACRTAAEARHSGAAVAGQRWRGGTTGTRDTAGGVEPGAGLWQPALARACTASDDIGQPGQITRLLKG